MYFRESEKEKLIEILSKINQQIYTKGDVTGEKNRNCVTLSIIYSESFFAALGVAFTKHGELGVSPISSVANVLSIKYAFFFFRNMAYYLELYYDCWSNYHTQKKFNLIQLLQVPLSFVFGWFTDFGMWIVSAIPANSYLTRIIMILVGIMILGFGISLAVIANVIMNSGEAFVKAISDTTGFEFGNIKISFNIICVMISIVWSLLFLIVALWAQEKERLFPHF